MGIHRPTNKYQYQALCAGSSLTPARPLQVIQTPMDSNLDLGHTERRGNKPGISRGLVRRHSGMGEDSAKLGQLGTRHCFCKLCHAVKAPAVNVHVAVTAGIYNAGCFMEIATGKGWALLSTCFLIHAQHMVILSPQAVIGV